MARSPDSDYGMITARVTCVSRVTRDTGSLEAQWELGPGGGKTSQRRPFERHASVPTGQSQYKPEVYRSWFLGHFTSGNHAAAPVLGESASRTAAGVRLYRSWFLGHFASGNHAAAPVLGKSAWRTAAGVLTCPPRTGPDTELENLCRSG